VTLLARYTYGDVNYTDADQFASQDSTTKSAYVSLATSDAQEQITWRVFYRSDRTDYENFLPYRYDQSGWNSAGRSIATCAWLENTGRRRT